MVIELTWPVIFGISGAILGWTGLFIQIANRAQVRGEKMVHSEISGLAKTIGTRLDKIEQHSAISLNRQEEHIRRVENSQAAQYAEFRKLEEDFRNLLAELPRSYVRHEDWVRFSNKIDAKQDALADLLRNYAERAYAPKS